MKTISIDFEYNRSSDPDMGLMAVSIAEGNKPPHSYWLYNDQRAKDWLANRLMEWKDDYTFLAHNVVAEASCFIALGLEPRDFTWIDTYLEYKQLANHNNEFRYGKYVDRAITGTSIRQSRPLVRRDELIELDELFGEERDDKMKELKARTQNASVLNQTLENALLNFVPECNYDPNTKRDARYLILECKDEYSEDEMAQILDYANDDTKWLRTIADRMLSAQMRRTGWSLEQTIQASNWRARYGVNVAKYTMHGIPLNLERLSNLEHNAEGVLNAAKEQFNSECWPIFSYKKTPHGWKMSKSTSKTNEMIQHLIDQEGLKWRTTKSGDYSTSTADGEPLQQYEDIHPWLKKFVRVRNLESVLKGYKKPDMDTHILDRDTVFRDNIGCDGRLRPWYGPFGTQTGRNAPGAKAFVFAQAAVMRALVEPPKGRIIMEIDYGSQEAFIAPILSGDAELLRAYTSGDPYLAFAQATGAAPAGATKDSHKDIRTLYKSTVLGLQYGMGAAKLAIKLTADIGRAVSTNEAKELIRQHREVYPRYYQWKEELWERYRFEQRPLFLRDGWYLDIDQLSRLSALNFPVQGTGSSMMRVCIDELYDEGIELICPVHDSMIVECDEEKADQVTEIVTRCMLSSSAKILGADGMRVGEPEIVRHGEYWETEKNVYDLPKFKKYFESALDLDPNKDIFNFVKKFIDT